MIRKLSMCLCTALLSLAAWAQDTTAVPTFKPSGAPVVRIETNFRQGLGAVNSESGFSITRAYIGYDYKATKDWRMRTVVDAAVPVKQGEKRTDIYLKNAMATWSQEKTIVNIGLIALMEITLQERWWGYRHVLKSAQDIQGMGPSADLGITVERKLLNWLSADIALINGEGYKNINYNQSFRYEGGITVSPSNNWVFRLYGDVYSDAQDLRPSVKPDTTGQYSIAFGNQYTLATFAGYQNKWTRIGAEYNIQYNNGFVKGRTLTVISAYASVFATNKLSIFARYDNTLAKDIPGYFVGWKTGSDGWLVATGVDYKPNKHLRITPNIRHYQPSHGIKAKQYVYVNVEFDL